MEEGRPSDRPYVPGVNERKYMIARFAHLGSAAAPAVVFIFYVVISVFVAEVRGYWGRGYCADLRLKDGW